MVDILHLKQLKDNSIDNIEIKYELEKFTYEEIEEIIKELYRITINKIKITAYNTESLNIIKNFSKNRNKTFIDMEFLDELMTNVGFETYIIREENKDIKEFGSFKEIFYISESYSIFGFKKGVDINFDLNSGVSVNDVISRISNKEYFIDNSIENIYGDLNYLQNENSALKKEIKKLKQENIENKNITKDIYKTIDELKKEIKETLDENQRVWKMYKDIENSKSWRYTKFLRVFKNYIKKYLK